MAERESVALDGVAGVEARATKGPHPGHRASEIVFVAVVLLTVVGLPLLVLRYDRSVASTRPGRVVTVVGRNDGVPGQAGHWMVQSSHGWDYRATNGPGIIRAVQGETLTLRLSAIEVVHEFSLPGYGITARVEPGKVTAVTFRADRSGEFPFQCTAYCRAGHDEMAGRLVVTPSQQASAGKEPSVLMR